VPPGTNVGYPPRDMRRSLVPGSGRSIVAALALAVVVTTGLVPLRPIAPVAAGTAESMEASILGWINDARVQRGLGSLRADSRVADLAGDRAARLAAEQELSHDTAGCLSCQLADRGIAWDLYGETLASNSWPWGEESARVTFESWRDSSSHWDILMTPQYDTIGVGVGLAADGVTYASAILIGAPGTTAVSTPKPKPAATPRPAPAPTPPPTPAPTSAPPTAGRAQAPIPRQALSPTVDWIPHPGPRTRRSRRQAASAR